MPEAVSLCFLMGLPFPYSCVHYMQVECEDLFFSLSL